MVVREGDHVLSLELAGEFSGDQGRVLGADSEGDAGTDVAEDTGSTSAAPRVTVAHLGLELSNEGA